MPYSARLLLTIVIVLFCPGAFACDLPDSVPIPDGRTATERDMVATDSAVKKFMTQMQSYVACVEAETSALRSRATKGDMAGAKQREDRAIELQNRAAAEMEKVAELFNQAIAEYKTRAR